MKLWAVVGLVVTWLVLVVGFSLRLGWEFAGAENLETIARQTTIVGLGTLGMTFVLVSGMVDLSAGSLVALVTVVIAYALRAGQPPLIAAMAGLGTGVVGGVLNGQIVTRMKLSPFIVTLGTMLALRGLAIGLADEKKIDVPLSWLTDILAKLPPAKKYMVFPAGVWALLGLALLASVLLERTVFGRNTIAVGANPEASRLAGISTEATRRWVFVLAGFFVGVAGLMQFARLTVGDPTVANGLELQIIAAAVIGGASLNGGQGSIVGSLFGALIMGTISSGCSQSGIPNWLQSVLTGAIIIIALGLDRLRNRTRES